MECVYFPFESLNLSVNDSSIIFSLLYKHLKRTAHKTILNDILIKIPNCYFIFSQPLSSEPFISRLYFQNISYKSISSTSCCAYCFFLHLLLHYRISLYIHPSHFDNLLSYRPDEQQQYYPHHITFLHFFLTSDITCFVISKGQPHLGHADVFSLISTLHSEHLINVIY